MASDEGSFIWSPRRSRSPRSSLHLPGSAVGDAGVLAARRGAGHDARSGHLVRAAQPDRRAARRAARAAATASAAGGRHLAAGPDGARAARPRPPTRTEPCGPLLVAEDAFGRRICRIGGFNETDTPFTGWLYRVNHVAADRQRPSWSPIEHGRRGALGVRRLRHGRQHRRRAGAERAVQDDPRHRSRSASRAVDFDGVSDAGAPTAPSISGGTSPVDHRRRHRAPFRWRRRERDPARDRPGSDADRDPLGPLPRLRRCANSRTARRSAGPAHRRHQPRATGSRARAGPDVIRTRGGATRIVVRGGAAAPTSSTAARAATSSSPTRATSVARAARR